MFGTKTNHPFQIADARVLRRPILHLERHQPPVEIRNDVHLAILFSTPVGKADAARVVAREDVLEKRRLHRATERIRVFQQRFALEQHARRDCRVGEVNLCPRPEHLLPVAEGQQPVNQMRVLQQRDEAPHRGPFQLQAGAQLRQIQQPAIVQAEVKKHLLQLQHPPHPEERRHVALQHLVHDVFPQEFLRQMDTLHDGALRKSTPQQILVKQPDQRTPLLAPARELRRLPRKQLQQRTHRRQWRHRQFADLQVFKERQRRQPDGLPAAHARLLTFRDQRRRRARHRDAPALFEIHLMLQPRLPVLRHLDFVEEQILRPLPHRLELAP